MGASYQSVEMKAKAMYEKEKENEKQYLKYKKEMKFLN